MDQYRVAQGTRLDLGVSDPSATGAYTKKKQARSDLAALIERLDGLQRVLWAGAEHKLLVVLQAMDAGGKDGTIRKVFGGLNPQGVTVTGFKKPTDD